MSIDNETKKMDPLSIAQGLTATLCREDGLDEKAATSTLIQVIHDTRYLSFCRAGNTSLQRYEFMLELARMIIQENQLKEFQSKAGLSSLEIKTLTDIATGGEEYLDFCKKNLSPLDRKKYEVSLIQKIFADDPDILRNFCIRPSRRLS